MEITTAVMPSTEMDAQFLANQYLTNLFGPGYSVANGFLGNGHWYFRIVYHCCHLPQSLGVGKLLVNVATGTVIPLTAEQIEDARDQAIEYRGEATEILRPTARRRMQGYLTNYVSLFAVPERPVYLDGNPPLWRATIFLQIRGRGRVCDLGTLDVNARTGDVIALSRKQLQIIRDRAQNATARTTLATATTR